MFDTEALQASLAAAVTAAVEAQSEKLRNATDANTLVVSTLAKPIMSFPDDVGAVLGCGRSTAFEVAKSPTFPPRMEVGRRRFIKTAAFMEWLDTQVSA